MFSLEKLCNKYLQFLIERLINEKAAISYKDKQQLYYFYALAAIENKSSKFSAK